MRRVLVLWGVLASSFAVGLDAQDLGAEFDSGSTAAPDAKTPPAGLGSGSSLSLDGDHEFVYHQPLYGDNWDFESAALQPEFDNTLGLKYQSGRLKVVAEGTIKTIAGPTSWTSMSQFQPGEAYVSWTPGPFLLNFGYQIFNWGVADTNNPSDGLNPRDYALATDASIVLDAPKIPVLAVDARWFPVKWFALEGVVSPYQSPSRFPVDPLDTTQTGLNAEAATLASSFGAAYPSYFPGYNPTASQSEPVDNPDSVAAAARASFYLASVDFAFSYIYDLDPYYTAVVQMKSYAGGWVPQQVELVRKRIHRFGTNVKTTVGPYGLWLETGFDLTENPTGSSDSVRKNRLSWTAGADFNWGPDDAFYVNLQYIGSWIPGYDETTASDYSGAPTLSELQDESYMEKMAYRRLTQPLGNYTETLSQGVSVKLKFPFSEDSITPSLTGVYSVPFGYDSTEEIRYGSLALKPEIDLMPVDSFHIRVGSDLAWAWVKAAGDSTVSLDTTTDRIGVYTPYNDLYVNVEYQWTTQ